MSPYSYNLPGTGYATLPNYGSGAALSYGSTIGNYGAPAPAPMPAPVVPAPTISTSGGPSYAPQVPAVQVPAPGGATAGAGGAAAETPQWGGWGNAMQNTFLNSGGGFNMKNVGNLAQTIGAFGQLWSGMQANKIAKESLGLQKEAYKTNLEGQRASYNMALEDRINSRYAQTGKSTDEAASYIAARRLGS